MTTWRPPVTPHERNVRAIRSMQNGSLDGRIVNAFPAKLYDPEDTAPFDELEELPEDETKGGDSLLPWTDYFYPQTGQLSFRYTLSHAPWIQEAMPSMKNRATVHVYWNGIFQTDIHYTLSGRVITIQDTKLAVRSGDTLSVKYWYDKAGTDDPDGEDPYPDYEEYRMNCAFMGASGYGGIPSTYASGALSAPPTGQNYGTVSLVATGYASTQFGSTWYTGFWVPAGMDLPSWEDIEDIRLCLWGPSNGDPGIIIGGVGRICASGSSGSSNLLADCTVCDPYTGLRNVNGRCSAERGTGGGSNDWDVDQRTPGPTGGCEFASGTLARGLLSVARLGVSVNWRYKGGFAAPGCLIKLNSTTDGNVDNTIYANRSLFLGTFPVTTGVTAYIKRK